MAAIGKIRSWGPTLAIVIGLALFAFIAEEAFRSCDGIKGEQRQQVGEVLGKKINVQEFQQLVDEQTNAQAMLSGRENLTEEETNALRDQVWQRYVSFKTIEADAQKAGLVVTDQEVKDVMIAGVNPLLQRDIPIPDFFNQQTQRFDYNQVVKFLDSYNKSKGTNTNPQMQEQLEKFHNLYLFCEKQLRQDLLLQKYNVLLANCVLSNTVEAERAFNDQNEEAEIQLAAIPFTTVKDADIKITEGDLKAKYEELKPLFKQQVETRDVKYVDVQIVASKADRAALDKQMADYQKQLAAVEDPAELITKSASLIPYSGLPMTADTYKKMNVDLDSMAVGTTNVFENKDDNTLNIIRVMAKTMLPDSVEYRQINITANTLEESRQRADSIMNALAGGADFEAIAKNYKQTATKSWFTGHDYEGALQNINADAKTLIDAMINTEAGQLKNIALSNTNVILEVTKRTAMKEKYTAAVIKKLIDFTKDTRSAYYNKFSEFVSQCKTIDDMQKLAAKYGYKVQEAKDINVSAFMNHGQFIPASHNLAGIGATRETLKWIFDAKEGAISQLYECGDNDHLLVVGLEKINPAGYVSMDNEQLNDYLKRMVMNDKKAEKIMANCKGVNSIAAAQKKGAKVSTVKQITFASPTVVEAVGNYEPALSGAVAGVKVGQFSKNPVKGNAGVYFFQVVSKAKRAGVKYDANTELQRCGQMAMQYVSNYLSDLVDAAQVVDKRYLFF